MKITKSNYHQIAKAGLNTGELGFVEQLANSWLKEFSNDIQSEFFLSQSALLRDNSALSAKYLTRILLKDPENIEAYELLFQNRDLKDQKAVASFIHVISGRTDDIESIFPWAVTLRAARNGIRRGELIHTEKLLRQLLAQEVNNPLVAIEHCRLSSIKDENSVFSHITAIYGERWPECIHFKIFAALASQRAKIEVNSVNLLHQCVAADPGGLVAVRMLGESHDFLTLWQPNQAINIDYQIPSSIAVSLEWNRLNSGVKDSPSTDDEKEILNTIQSQRQDHRTSGSQRKSINTPVYVILTTYNGLSQKYGEKTASFLIEQLENLCETINRRPHWDSIVFRPDELASVQQFGLSPINKIEPWQIKLAIHDLDDRLNKQSKTIGALLIVGGEEIVPFHNLPNPTDDSDKSVPSDNPYGTSSTNYLVQEWPVGRLPDEKGRDAGLLLEQIRQIHQFHSSNNSSRNRADQLISDLKRKLDIRRFFTDFFHAPKDFGYTTAVWRRSSLAAFRPIGKGSDLRVSPQYDSDTIDVENLMRAKCAYFNLHGLADTPDWYGQRDFSEDPVGPDFPVAITARQIEKIRNNVDLVFSEACYGGFILNKTIDNSMALKLVSVGSQGLVASTCIAYGSVFTPLIGADLLGFIFWKYTKDGFSFGESLLQAKLGLIKVMTQRQGYLDGEDQKTLQSFVLYGDPLGYLEPNIYMDKNLKVRGEDQWQINAFSDADGILSKNTRVSDAKATEISEMVQSYIPRIDNADVKVREHQVK
ncbi:MAG: hypothetical protein FJZ98_08385, partial [Chloroflexi bacterium]|nr:hypothetical protein [Chloroflexota bacterium]